MMQILRGKRGTDRVYVAGWIRQSWKLSARNSVEQSLMMGRQRLMMPRTNQGW